MRTWSALNLFLCLGHLACCFAGEPKPALRPLRPGTDYIYLCRDAGAGGHEGLPDICRTTDGTLIAVFFAGYDHGSWPSKDLPKGGRVCYALSADEGRSWSAPAVLVDTDASDRDPSVVQLKDGRLFCTFMNSFPPQLPWRGTLACTSTDGGRHWSEPVRLIEGYYATQPARILSSGKVLLPLYRQSAASANAAVSISDDGGLTWSKPVDIDNAGLPLSAETDVIELTNGSIYAIERFGCGPMQKSISTDGGKSWSRSTPVGFPGITPCLLRATNDIIVLAYGPCFNNSRWSTGLRYSRDECRTWSELVMADDVLGCHPSMTKLKDGSVLLAYYDERTGPEPGDKSDVRLRKFRVTREGIEWLTWDSQRSHPKVDDTVRLECKIDRSPTSGQP